MIRAAILALALASPAVADPAERAMQAARALEAATIELQAASGGRDRITALSRTIQAYEDGLIALRDGLRDAQLREAALAASFAARSEDLTRLLGVLMATDRIDAQAALLHPEGALAASRAGMVLGAVAPALGKDVAALREELEDLRALRRARQFGLLALEQGLSVAQDARVALGHAIAERGPLPRTMIDDPARLDALARDAATLDDFAAELVATGWTMGDRPVGSFQAAQGTLDLPVRATVLRRFGQADAAGVSRPGLVLATGPAALVTTPWDATVRYAGTLAGRGHVVIVEPAEGVLLVMTGMGETLVAQGEILPRGAPIGTMPQDATGTETGNRSQTLYFEMRMDGKPIDPEPWFAFTGR